MVPENLDNAEPWVHQESKEPQGERQPNGNQGRWDPRNTWLSRTAGSERRAPSASCAPGKAISRDTKSVYYFRASVDLCVCVCMYVCVCVHVLSSVHECVGRSVYVTCTVCGVLCGSMCVGRVCAILSL